MKTLLLGMGNPILSDDAIGIRLAWDIGDRLLGCYGLTVRADCSVGGLEVLDVLAGYGRAVIIDSIQTAGGVPGQWHAFGADALRETMHLTNVHDANFATALALGHRLGMSLPEPSAIRILAVEVNDAATFSEQLTPALEERYPALLNEIYREVRRLLSAWPVCCGDPALEERGRFRPRTPLPAPAPDTGQPAATAGPPTPASGYVSALTALPLPSTSQR
jgi:hydrogenase maturation protease